MKSQKTLLDNTQTKKLPIADRVPDGLPAQQKSQPELTKGQRLADAMTTKIGSWTFLTLQSSVLAVWIGMNSLPGVPHWDQSPFILLNLVFSFASAYTAPIVLMSQNRQSEEDRKIAELDYKVNQQAAQNIELLHEKMDSLQSQQLLELAKIVKQQQQALNKITASLEARERAQAKSQHPDESSEDKLIYLKQGAHGPMVAEKRERRV